jgi:hypothetical protein
MKCRKAVMKRRLKISALLTSMTLLLLSFQNCGQFHGIHSSERVELFSFGDQLDSIGFAPVNSIQTDSGLKLTYAKAVMNTTPSSQTTGLPYYAIFKLIHWRRADVLTTFLSQSLSNDDWRKIPDTFHETPVIGYVEVVTMCKDRYCSELEGKTIDFTNGAGTYGSLARFNFGRQRSLRFDEIAQKWNLNESLGAGPSTLEDPMIYESMKRGTVTFVHMPSSGDDRFEIQLNGVGNVAESLSADLVGPFAEAKSWSVAGLTRDASKNFEPVFVTPPRRAIGEMKVESDLPAPVSNRFSSPFSLDDEGKIQIPNFGQMAYVSGYNSLARADMFQLRFVAGTLSADQWFPSRAFPYSSFPLGHVYRTRNVRMRLLASEGALKDAVGKTFDIPTTTTKLAEDLFWDYSAYYEEPFEYNIMTTADVTESILCRILPTDSNPTLPGTRPITFTIAKIAVVEFEGVKAGGRYDFEVWGKVSEGAVSTTAHFHFKGTFENPKLEFAPAWL